MLKKKIILFTLLLMLAFSGCISYQVEIKFPPSIALNKTVMSSFNISYTNTYPEPQNVTINLKTNDQRLGLSLSDLDIFNPSISLREEVGSGYTNLKHIYVKVIDSSIPYGNYKITAYIEGEKSQSLIKLSPDAEITVSIVTE